MIDHGEVKRTRKRKGNRDLKLARKKKGDLVTPPVCHVTDSLAAILSRHMCVYEHPRSGPG